MVRRWLVGLATAVLGLALVSVAVPASGDTVSPDTIPLTFGPQGIAITPDGSRLALGSAFGENAAGVVNLSASPASAYPRLTIGDFAPGVAVTPDSRYALVTAQTGLGSLSVIDLKASGGPSIVSTLDMTDVGLPGLQPCQVTISPDGGTAYVSLLGDSAVAVFDLGALPTITLDRVITVADQPIGVAVSSNGKYLASANQATSATHNVSIVNLDTNALTNIDLGHAAWNVVFTPDGKRAYVTEPAADAVAVIDLTTSTPTLLTTIHLASGSGPQGLAVTPDGTRVYVTDQTSGDVAVIDVASNTESPDLLTIAGATPLPTAIAINAAGTRAYVTNLNIDDISVISIDAYPGITTTTLPAAHVGQAYSTTVSGTGTAPLSFAVTSGALPPGLSLNSTTGKITGSATASGSFTFAISATNHASGFTGAATPTATRTFTLVSTLVLATTGTDTVGTSYAAGISASVIVLGLVLLVTRRRRITTSRAATPPEIVIAPR